MNILWLGPLRVHLIEYIRSLGDEVAVVEYPLTIEAKCLEEKDFVISYGYRHILNKDIIARFRGRAINLHISLLPWNRGSDPNFWSFFDDTPKGVTIHFLDEGIDTGDIVAQQSIEVFDADTLRTSYGRLSETMERLFIDKWPEIRAGRIKPVAQPENGSFHLTRDREKYDSLLVKGWDTPVKDIIGKGRERQL